MGAGGRGECGRQIALEDHEGELPHQTGTEQVNGGRGSVAARLLWKTMKGNSLTRREQKQVIGGRGREGEYGRHPSPDGNRNGLMGSGGGGGGGRGGVGRHTSLEDLTCTPETG